MNNIEAGQITIDLDPVLVTSPTLRCGTTLLQRLLCSSPDTMLYGESCGQDMEFFMNVYMNKAHMYQFNRAQLAGRFDHVAAGEVNSWILDLMPPMDGYLEALARSSFAGLTYCRDCAVRAGRPIWGVKYPGWQPFTLQSLRRMIPKCRIVYIHRDLVDCLKSAKAHEMVSGEQDTINFCRAWATNLSYMASIVPDPGILFLRYTDLVEKPAEVLSLLTEFTGARSIDPHVLDHKINTWTSGGAGAPQGPGYIPPESLTDREREIIDSVAGTVRQGLYPGEKRE